MLIKHQKPVIVYTLIGEQRPAGSEALSIKALKADLFFLSKFITGGTKTTDTRH